MLTAKGMTACKQAAFEDYHSWAYYSNRGGSMMLHHHCSKDDETSWVTRINPFSALDVLDLKTTVMAMSNDFLLARAASSTEKLYPVLSAAVKAVQLHQHYWLTC